jgi:hypothetical protein
VRLEPVRAGQFNSNLGDTMRYLKPSRSQQVREKVNEIFA